jgi:hypothetical protein
MTDTDLRNSAALAEFSNWAAGIRDAVQQSLQPFSASAHLLLRMTALQVYGAGVPMLRI